jgi:hypothetical protein
MGRPQLLSLVVLTILASAGTVAFYAEPASVPCFQSGSASYSIVSDGPADLTVRVDAQAAHPDVRAQLVDDALSADTVLVDDGARTCPAASVRTLRIAAPGEPADLIVALSRAPAAQTAYVKSERFPGAAAAALYAAISQRTHTRLASTH